MDAIEKRALHLLCGEIDLDPEDYDEGERIEAGEALRAVIAALTPPEGYVLVQEAKLRHLLSDAITSVEFIAGRGQSKPLSRRVSDQAWALVESIPARRKVP
ncbi:hypothetical protein ABE543_06910 [Stenotrophomonas sp. TWI169]|uniref:hypothetical protein n=1 Tax=Stenotrophomonas sp. TWI169 TaxID=3136773 RepID=UPI003207BB15